jgi:hypothetical protein
MTSIGTPNLLFTNVHTSVLANVGPPMKIHKVKAYFISYKFSLDVPAVEKAKVFSTCFAGTVLHS